MPKSMTDELQLLENENIFKIRALEYQAIKLKVFLIAAAYDKPAQAFVKNLPEPISEFCCGRCKIQGGQCFIIFGAYCINLYL